VTLDELLALYEGPAAEVPYDEVVNEREHALQGAELAIAAGAPDALVLAALLHDVGHLLPGGRAAPDDRHEATGAAALRTLFGPSVSVPVALHVEAKRYLCTVDTAYHDTLSPGSQWSLAEQGGPMTADEVRAFERRPSWEAAVQLRRWDDQAKVKGGRTRPLSAFRHLLEGQATER
jgi:predicted HD phosphohydrolase